MSPKGRKNSPKKAPDYSRLVGDLRRLRNDCFGVTGRAAALLRVMDFTSPDEPEVWQAYQHRLSVTEEMFLLNQANWCCRALSGDQHVAGDSPCQWCALKAEQETNQQVARFNARVRHFKAALFELQTQRIDHAQDDERGFDVSIALAYDAKEQFLKRAAQLWILRHPVPECYGGPIPGRDVQRRFCASQLLHMKCGNRNCFDCHGYIWLVYVNRVLAWVSEWKTFEAAVARLPAGRGPEVDFYSNIDLEARRKGFSFFGGRKRAIMKTALEWAAANPLPSLQAIKNEFGPGPMNTVEFVNPMCRFFQCSDEDCRGLH